MREEARHSGASPLSRDAVLKIRPSDDIVRDGAGNALPAAARTRRNTGTP